MSNIKEKDLQVRFISLPLMRMMWHMAIGISPEDERMMTITIANHSELCFKEHIRNNNPEGCGNEYYLNLLQPVRLKT